MRNLEAGATDYGSTQNQVDLLKEGRTVFGVELTQNQLFAITYLGGLLTFLLTLLAANTLFFSHYYVVTSIYVLVFGSTFYFWYTRSSMLHQPLGLSCLCALAFGAFVGLYCYDRWGYLAFLYGNARTYQNVVVSQPAASYADCGRMVFAAEAYVDQTKAAGYAGEDGTKYCVAPLRDLVQTTHVEFWAVGFGCCSWSGSFTCDASKDSGSRGGIVVFDTPGYFASSNKDYYDLAREKSQAMYGLVSAKKPLYVRWVKNNELGMLQSYYQLWAALMIILFFTIYAAVTFPFTRSFSARLYKDWLGLPQTDSQKDG